MTDPWTGVKELTAQAAKQDKDRDWHQQPPREGLNKKSQTCCVADAGGINFPQESHLFLIKMSPESQLLICLAHSLPATQARVLLTFWLALDSWLQSSELEVVFSSF